MKSSSDINFLSERTSAESLAAALSPKQQDPKRMIMAPIHFNHHHILSSVQLLSGCITSTVSNNRLLTMGR